jgi:hypothetical protein
MMSKALQNVTAVQYFKFSAQESIGESTFIMMSYSDLAVESAGVIPFFGMLTQSLVSVTCFHSSVTGPQT